jgi:hypothetical protein
MPELHFQIEVAEAIPHAAAPLLALQLRIRNTPAAEEIHSILLRCQVQIEPAKRRYHSDEQQGLTELFGEPERWSRTVRPLLWMNTTLAVPGFSDTCLVQLQLPCTFDFNVAATKYFHALHAGEIPLCVMFSGTIFYRDAEEAMQVTQVPWDAYYPNSAWLRLRRDTFEQLAAYKRRNGIPTWEQAIERILTVAEIDEVRA